MDNLLAENDATNAYCCCCNQVIHRNNPQHTELTFDVFEYEIMLFIIDESYSTIKSPRGRAISGLSMGDVIVCLWV